MNQIRGILFESQDLAYASDPLFWSQLIFFIFSLLLVTTGPYGAFTASIFSLFIWSGLFMRSLGCWSR